MMRGCARKSRAVRETKMTMRGDYSRDSSRSLARSGLEEEAVILRRSERLTARGTPTRLMLESFLDALDAEDVPADGGREISSAVETYRAFNLATGHRRRTRRRVLYGDAILPLVLLLVRGGQPRQVDGFARRLALHAG